MDDTGRVASTTKPPVAPLARVSRVSRVSRGLGLVVLYAALAVYLLHPGFSDPLRGNIATVRAGRVVEPDTNLVMWVLAWDWHALWTNPLALYDANAFYPARTVLAASEHMLGHIPLFGPAYALTDNPVAAIQFNVLMSFVLSATGVYALLRHWGTGPMPAFFAGFVYAFALVRVGLLGSPHLLAGYYLPVAFLALDRCLRDQRLVWALLFGAALLLQMLCSYYLAYISLVALAGYAMGILWVSRTRLPRRGALLAAAAAAAALAVLGVVSIPYAQLADTGVISDYKTDARLILASTDFWRTYLVRPSAGASAHIGYRPYYLGLSVLLCGLGALGWRRSRTAVVPWAAAGALGSALACYVFGLGPAKALGGHFVPLPYAWAMEVVPGFSSMRVPFRFALFVPLGVACLAGLGLERMYARVGAGTAARRTATVLLLAVATWDLGLLDQKYTTHRQAVASGLPPIYRRFAKLPPGPVLEFPIRPVYAPGMLSTLRETQRMLYSTYHWFPLLNGASGYAPPSYRVVVSLAQALPGREALALLGRTTGLRYILVHMNQVEAAGRDQWRRPEGLRLAIRDGNDWLFKVDNPPEADLLPKMLDADAPSHTILGTPLELLPHAQRRASVRFAHTPPAEVLPRRELALSVEVTNPSSVAWPAVSPATANLVTVRCRWTADTGEPESRRNRGVAYLTSDLKPGQTAAIRVRCPTPRITGAFHVEVGVAQGGEWFQGITARHKVQVVKRPVDGRSYSSVTDAPDSRSKD